MKLSGHSQQLHLALPFIKKLEPEYWKAIDPDTESAKTVYDSGTKLVVRHYADPIASVSQAVANPLQAAKDFAWECANQPWFPYAWAIETHNEPMPFYDSRIDEYKRFEYNCVQVFESMGKECVVGHMGTGNTGHTVYTAKYYGAHDYGWPNILDQSPNHALMYRYWFASVLDENPDAKLFITECGVTRAVVDPTAVQWQDFEMGWKSDGRSAKEYWQGSLQPYLQAIDSDSYVLAAFIFQAAGLPAWASFEILGTEIESFLLGEVDDMNVDIVKQHENEFWAWVNAGGWKQFALFLMATGQVPYDKSLAKELLDDKLTSVSNESRLLVSKM